MKRTFQRAPPLFEYKHPTTRHQAVYDGETRLGWVEYCPAQHKWLTYQANGSFIPSQSPCRSREKAAALLGPLDEQAALYEGVLRWHRHRPRKRRS